MPKTYGLSCIDFYNGIIKKKKKSYITEVSLRGRKIYTNLKYLHIHPDLDKLRCDI